MAEFTQTGTTAVGGEPVTLNDVEGQCRIVDLSAEANTIEMMISAVREKAEDITKRALVRKTEVLKLNSFPSGSVGIKLIKPPIVSITSIVYTDVNGDEQTLSSLAYKITTLNEVPYIVPTYGLTWPTALSDIDSVAITYLCGLTPDEIPNKIKQWMLVQISNLYENRESQGVAMGRSTVFNLDATLCDGLIESYRLHRL